MNKYIKECVKAQTEYTKRKKLPLFAPTNGRCEYCFSYIYGESGYTIEDARERLITGCPHCCKSFCD